MSMSQEEIEALMSGAGDIEPEQDEIASEDSSQEDNNTEEVVSVDGDDNIDEILSGIDGIVDDESDSKSENSPDDKETDSSTSENMEDMIDSNQYPLPVKNENKVVNQLNQVADDSEEKASQIFDVLSFILDENNEIQNYNKTMSGFVDKQIELLNSLSVKFPNIDIFRENLEEANQMIETSKQLSSKIDNENNKVFEAMELMQYHDINRQKIERVMAVIRKLNSYLNGIFEDESDRAEVQIAKHISGDSNDIVNSDDLESLISEFANEG